jgi:hypothetical protein
VSGYFIQVERSGRSRDSATPSIAEPMPQGRDFRAEWHAEGPDRLVAGAAPPGVRAVGLVGQPYSHHEVEDPLPARMMAVGIHAESQVGPLLGRVPAGECPRAEHPALSYDGWSGAALQDHAVLGTGGSGEALPWGG